MLCEGIFLFIYINFVFHKGFFSKWHFYLGLGWGKFITVCYVFINLIIYLGLPVPIVAIATGIANKHYGSENGLVNLNLYIRTYVHSYILTYKHTYMLTYLHTYIPTYEHTYMLTYIHTYIRTYVHTYIHTHTYIHYVCTYVHVILIPCFQGF